jgi:hypothetical protein
VPTIGHQSSQRVEILFRQFYEEPVAAAPAPAVAFDAADEPLAVVVDFDD